MKAGPLSLQIARVIVLLALLRSTGWYGELRSQREGPLVATEAWGSCAVISLISVAFIACVLVGRQVRHPWAVVGVEAAVAAVLAFVPPLQWVLWFGTTEWVATLGAGFVQPLAVAWFVVVVAVGYRQMRTRTASNSSDGVPAPAAGRPPA